MYKKELNKSEALNLLHEKMKNENLRRHCYAVGKVLADFYDFFPTSGKLTKEQWEIAGILHDADWEITKDSPDRHTIELLEWLENYEVEPDLLEVFRSHNSKTTKLREPETRLEWTLECCDELTGFIVAVALVMPEKKLEQVTVDSVLKKFKQKEFAKQVDREQISQCEQKLGVSLNDFVSMTLSSMKKNSGMLGL
ncbi:MAG: Metal dependent phosphohydrolase [candidate division WWE3 bacterium GW2011_GWF2_41_45]|uniref:HD domain-containing protein n=3 Tax=Katanobacteria TaxID=422282 RepID=A0A1F4W0Y0_UNCKA|nr:MAG: Metal dependent phosphohydrolase [candidate division WWE3 bacterium GW2011_GWC2_41_23]KKS10041.1 MAG: Metal dependent phosphohydrolase [candidate division WWE3 bacterium GW2011_GWF2_41_45]KKS12001.1 MAG: Metal dependent phosphohydrolase [candidate division WWE3 bacterium GW2011_GWF1_41_53]KKS19891.1 MAG: Metal dependent phosphohydrolase [candidate division WWE3 bacterium GW2011_GWE1_41_72]KKS27042.1 MAG: Metal dependent phosphohydrolase [candidate division WWE3 bacterium GW2011_GWC1_42_